jgi:hypothetical protein
MARLVSAKILGIIHQPNYSKSLSHRIANLGLL